MKKITTNKLTEEISVLMLDKKASDIKIVMVKGLTSLTDYFINCSSDSEPQTKAIKNHIFDTLAEKYKIKPAHIEGYQELHWVLIDYIDIVINIFNKEKREFYNIERLWADAKIKIVKEKNEK